MYDIKSYHTKYDRHQSNRKQIYSMELMITLQCVSNHVRFIQHSSRNRQLIQQIASEPLTRPHIYDHLVGTDPQKKDGSLEKIQGKRFRSRSNTQAKCMMGIHETSKNIGNYFGHIGFNTLFLFTAPASDNQETNWESHSSSRVKSSCCSHKVEAFNSYLNNRQNSIKQFLSTDCHQLIL